jgi:hypothetical protein
VIPRAAPNPRPRQEPWDTNAACRNLPDPDVMYPDPTDEPGTAHALTFCAVCPVGEECLAVADSVEGDVKPAGRFGIRGGLTPVNRWRARKGLPLVEQPAPRPLGTRAPPPPPARTRKRAAQDLRPCGTRAAYQRHRRWGEEPCDACREANHAEGRGAA